MPRTRLARPPAPTAADELLAALTQAHRELAARLLVLRQQTLTGGQVDGWSLKFVERRLKQVESAIAEVHAAVLGPPGEYGLAAQAVQAAYAAGLLNQNFALNLQGVDDIPAPNMEDLHLPAMRRIAQELTDGYSDMHRGILRREVDAYRTIQARATMIAGATGETGAQLMGRYVREFVAEDMVQGGLVVGNFTRRWRVEDYAEMLGRTVVQKANREASLARTSETGHDLVVLIGGRIERTCKTCKWADGKVFSISNQTAKPEGVPDSEWGGPMDLVTAHRSTTRDRKVGEKHSAAVGHPRCIHSWGTYVEEGTQDLDYMRDALENHSKELGIDIAWGDVEKGPVARLSRGEKERAADAAAFREARRQKQEASA